MNKILMIQLAAETNFKNIQNIPVVRFNIIYCISSIIYQNS